MVPFVFNYLTEVLWTSVARPPLFCSSWRFYQLLWVALLALVHGEENPGSLLYRRRVNSGQKSCLSWWETQGRTDVNLFTSKANGAGKNYVRSLNQFSELDWFQDHGRGCKHVTDCPYSIPCVLGFVRIYPATFLPSNFAWAYHALYTKCA